MPNEKVLLEKQQYVAELKDKLTNAAAGVLVDYKGITVADDTKLRKELREAGVEYRVVKNTMLRLALKDTRFADLAEQFTGPTAIAFANDPVSACKACVEFAKGNEKLVIIGGAMGTGILSVDDIKRLASIPSVEELRAKIIGLLQAPAAQLARVTKAYSEKDMAA